MSEFTMVILLIFGIIGFIVWASVQEEQKKQRESELKAIALEVQGYIAKINQYKSNATKRTNCEKALIALRPVPGYKDYDDVFKNYHDTVSHLESLEKVLPVCDYIEKADKHRFKGSNSSEKNSLLDALYHIEINSVTDDDFQIADITDDRTGEVVEINKIESRLKELGWEKKDKTG